jgi:hypothetical protein
VVPSQEEAIQEIVSEMTGAASREGRGLDSLTAVESFVDQTIASQAWISCRYFIQPMVVRVRSGTSERFSADYLGYSLWECDVELPPFMWIPSGVCHILAHVGMTRVVRQEPHGPAFARAWWYLVRHCIGTAEADELQRAYARLGVAWWWPERGDIDWRRR